MSRQLILLPFDLPSFRASSWAVLPCSNLSDLNYIVDAIVAKHGRDVPQSFNSYISREPTSYNPDGETHWGLTAYDANGRPLRYVTALHLLEYRVIDPKTARACSLFDRVRSEQSGWGRDVEAAFTYLQVLGPHTAVAVWLC